MKGKSGNKRIIFQANLVLYLTIIDAVYFSDICNHFTQTDLLHSEGFIFILIKQKEKWSHKLTDRFYPVNLLKTGACLCLNLMYTIGRSVASVWSKQWWTLEARFSAHLPESGAAQLEDSKLFFRRNWPNLQPSVAQTLTFSTLPLLHQSRYEWMKTWGEQSESSWLRRAAAVRKLVEVKTAKGTHTRTSQGW